MYLLIVLILSSVQTSMLEVVVELCVCPGHHQDGLQVSKSPSRESEFSLLMLVSGQDSSSEGQHSTAYLVSSLHNSFIILY